MENKCKRPSKDSSKEIIKDFLLNRKLNKEGRRSQDRLVALESKEWVFANISKNHPAYGDRPVEHELNKQAKNDS